MKDLFEKYLEKKNDINHPYIKIDLTDKSYRTSRNLIKNENLNGWLGTYGDAILKLGYVEILLKDNTNDLSSRKEKLEEDKNLVRIIASHYNILTYLDHNKKAIDYDYKSRGKTSSDKNKKDNPRKYIATAVEAMIGAIYIYEGKDIKKLLPLLEKWKKLIEDANK